MTTLYSFTGRNDGAFSIGGLSPGNDGNFYGATYQGGNANFGTIYRFSPLDTLTTLYSFRGTGDGENPYSTLTQGTDGNFYGTTTLGDAGFGTAFRITPGGALTTLHAFTSGEGGSSFDGLTLGSDGNFYGTTVGGDTSNNGDTGGGYGAAYRMTPAGALTVLHPFANGSDGAFPQAGLVEGADGNLYGASYSGRAIGQGATFKVTPAGGFTILSNYTNSQAGHLQEAMLLGKDGNFYGTTYYGGANANGVVFKLTPAGVLTTLHSFNGADGRDLYSKLVQGSDGNLYGTTAQGGLNDMGTVFRLTLTGELTTLHHFNGSDGSNPYGGLILGGDGYLYGTTFIGGGSFYGGTSGYGTIFKISTTPPPSSLQFTASSATVQQGTSSVTLSVRRVDSSTGDVAVDYSTANGTALSQIDYGPIRGTLFWSSGDSAPKTITVPLIDRHLSTGSASFLVNLSQVAGGAVLGAPAQVAVTILYGDQSAQNIQSVSLLSPPTDIRILQNQKVRLYAEVDALANTLANVEIYAVDDASGVSTDLGGFTSQRGQKTWQPAVAGNFTLKVVATDTQGQTKQANNPIHVISAANTGAAPQASLYGLLDGRTLALNDTVPVVAQALDSNGNPLQNVQFYLDGQPIASTPITNAATRPTHAKANGGSSASGLYLTNPNLTALEQLITVIGTNAQGVSVVSQAANLFAKANAATPPRVAISNLADGASLPADTEGRVVSVSAQQGTQPIAQVELVVDNQSVGVVTAAPYEFNLPALPEGTHALTAIASTTSDQVSKVSAPVIVKAERSGSLHPAFFAGESVLGNGVYFLTLPDGNPFGYYSYLADPAYIFHFDLGYEYLFDAADGKGGVYLYDFASNSFFYTSPSFPFPYLYDFSLNTVLLYFSDPSDPTHYNTNGIRYFFRFDTGLIFSK